MTENIIPPEQNQQAINNLEKCFLIISRADTDDNLPIDRYVWIKWLKTWSNSEYKSKTTKRPLAEVDKDRIIKNEMLARTFHRLCYLSNLEPYKVCNALYNYLMPHDIHKYTKEWPTEEIPNLTIEEKETLNRFGLSGIAFCDRIRSYHDIGNIYFVGFFPIDPTIPIPVVDDEGKAIG